MSAERTLWNVHQPREGSVLLVREHLAAVYQDLSMALFHLAVMEQLYPVKGRAGSLIAQGRRALEIARTQVVQARREVEQTLLEEQAEQHGRVASA